MLAVRWTRSESGLVAAKASTAAIRTTMAMPMILSMAFPPSLLGLGLLPRGDLGAQALFLLPQLRGEFGAEVLRLEDLADLDLLVLERGALEPLDRLVLRLHPPDPVAGDQLLGLGEGAVDHGRLAVRELDPRAFRARLEAVGRKHDAGVDQLLVEFAHRGEQLLTGHHARLGILVGLDQDHESHGCLLFGLGAGV